IPRPAPVPQARRGARASRGGPPDRARARPRPRAGPRAGRRARRSRLRPPRRASCDLGELRGAVFGEQRVDDLVERLAGEHLVDLVEREIDAMVGDAALREVVGADPFRPIARADLALALGRAFGVPPLAFRLVEAGAQHLHGLRLALVLRPLVLLTDDDPGGNVGDAD